MWMKARLVSQPFHAILGHPGIHRNYSMYPWPTRLSFTVQLFLCFIQRRCSSSVSSTGWCQDRATHSHVFNRKCSSFRETSEWNRAHRVVDTDVACTSEILSEHEKMCRLAKFWNMGNSLVLLLSLTETIYGIIASAVLFTTCRCDTKKTILNMAVRNNWESPG